MKKRIFQTIILTLILSLTSCMKNETTQKDVIIYSVTTEVDNSVLKDWLSWVDGHIEHVLETGRFSKAVFSKVNGLENNTSETYTIMFCAHSKESIEAYRKEDAPKLKKGTLERFPKGLTNTRAEYTFIKEFTGK